jgi:iron complex transport system ATP-binding protein
VSDTKPVRGTGPVNGTGSSGRAGLRADRVSRRADGRLILDGVVLAPEPGSTVGTTADPVGPEPGTPR